MHTRRPAAAKRMQAPTDSFENCMITNLSLFIHQYTDCKVE